VTKIYKFKKRTDTPEKYVPPRGNLLLAVFLLLGLSIVLVPFFLFYICTYWMLPKHAKPRAKAWFEEIHGEGYRILQQIESGEDNGQ
jgi:hypothetical protein